MANACRVKHLAYRTEQAYVGWVKRFILFHNKRHPSEMGADEVRAFLTHLAVNRRVAASTQNQALIVKDQDDPQRRLYLPAKLNLSQDPDGLAYRIVEGKVVWELDPVRMHAA